jgi:hypothetical protein
MITVFGKATPPEREYDRGRRRLPQKLKSSGFLIIGTVNGAALCTL